LDGSLTCSHQEVQQLDSLLATGRHGATAVNIRSATRLPDSLSDPQLPLRHCMAGRRAR